MKALAYLFAVAAGLSGAAVAQTANPQAAADSPQKHEAPPAQGNRDPGAETVPLPADNPGSTAVDSAAVEAPRTSDQSSDRITSREWQGLGSTGGGTGTGASSGTTADEAAPGQDANRPAVAGAAGAQDANKAMPETRPQPPWESAWEE